MPVKATILESNGAKSYSVELKGWDSIAKMFDKTADDITKKQVTLSLATVGLGLLLKRVPQGISYEGRKFADYSTVPMYMSRKQGFGKLKGIGKTGKTTFRNGEKHRSMYLPGGYAQLRRAMGRDANGRLIFSGKMLNNMTVATSGANASKIYFPSAEQRAKASGNQTKYHFFGLTEGETNIVAQKYFNLVTNAIGGK
jgi:hypothetical protein